MATKRRLGLWIAAAAGYAFLYVPLAIVVVYSFNDSKLNAEWAFLTMLRDRGRAAAADFLAAHRDDLGQRSSLELDSLLEGA